MGIILPLITFSLLVAALRGRAGLRLAWMWASLCMGTLVVLSSEVLSLFQALTRPALYIFWGAALLLAALANSLAGRQALPRPAARPIFNQRWLNLLAWLIPAGLLAATFVIALVAPPNNTDAMVYHLSRVAHWAQNRSVALFASSTLRELYLNPLAEYSILHTYLLSGSDRFANLVQWFAYASTGVAVSLIARQLGASSRGQYLAALFAFSLPQALLQASSTQNDLFFAAQVLTAVFFILRFAQEGHYRLLLAAAAATALAVLAKSTAFIVLAPFMLWVLVKLAAGWKKINLAACGLAILLAVGLVLPFYLRNARAFGSPLGPAAETSLYTNQAFGLRPLLSNTVRNLAINFTYTPGVSAWAEQAVTGLHRPLGFSVSDPRTTWQEYTFAIRPFTVSEDLSGAPLHIWLVLAVLAGMLAARRRFSSAAHGLALCLVLGFLLFSAYLKWQPWNNRLELVFFALAAPLFGLAVEKIRRLPAALALGLALYSRPYFYFGPTKPLVQDWNIFTRPRIEMMIRNKDLLAPYINSSIYIDDNLKCQHIGMELANGYWEYPFWNMLVDPARPQRTLQHINVSNASRALEPQGSQICAVLLINENEKPTVIQYQGAAYRQVFLEDIAAVYVIQQP